MWYLEGRPKLHYTQLGVLPPGDMLHQESETYQREVGRLLAEGGEGKFVLLKGNEIIGVFEDEREAMRIGYSKYLRHPFMVHQIREWEPILRLPWSVRPCHTSHSS